MLRKDLIRPIPNAHGSDDPAEIARFNALAEEWRKPGGRFKVVHSFNAARVDWIVQSLRSMTNNPDSFDKPLSGLSIADVGCGVGLVTEPLAQAGARLIGIDASAQSIMIAQNSAARSGLGIQYRLALPELLLAERVQYDAVISLEVIEHVADLRLFLEAISKLVRPGGRLIVGTINRTIKSWALAKFMAERVLGWLPRGTHDWARFVKPEETASIVARNGFSQVTLCGIGFDPLTWQWKVGTDASVNYLQVFDRSNSLNRD